MNEFKKAREDYEKLSDFTVDELIDSPIKDFVRIVRKMANGEIASFIHILRLRQGDLVNTVNGRVKEENNLSKQELDEIVTFMYFIRSIEERINYMTDRRKDLLSTYSKNN